MSYKIEVENTARALRDEPLIVTSRLCRFGIHQWSKYKEPVKVGTKYSGASGGYNDIMIQEKRCVHCNISNHRKFKVFSRG